MKALFPAGFINNRGLDGTVVIQIQILFSKTVSVKPVGGPVILPNIFYRFTEKFFVIYLIDFEYGK